MADPAAKPPPATLPRKVQIPKQSNAAQVVELYLQVLPDGTSGAAMDGAETSYKLVGLIPTSTDGGVAATSATPSIETRVEGTGAGARKLVSKVLGAAQIRMVVQIQTAYGQKARPSDPSAYGRGTTPEDEQSGETSLGFHEACHRDNFVRYLESENLPVFGGRAGMTVEQYRQAESTFMAQVQSYFTKMADASVKSTDEVGYTLAEFNSKGRRTTPRDAGADGGR